MSKVQVSPTRTREGDSLSVLNKYQCLMGARINLAKCLTLPADCAILSLAARPPGVARRAGRAGCQFAQLSAGGRISVEKK